MTLALFVILSILQLLTASLYPSIATKPSPSTISKVLPLIGLILRYSKYYLFYHIFKSWGILYKSSSLTSGSLDIPLQNLLILNLEFKQFIYTLFSASVSISTNDQVTF